jgi:hypothetical protein
MSGTLNLGGNLEVLSYFLLFHSMSLTLATSIRIIETFGSRPSTHRSGLCDKNYIIRHSNDSSCLIKLPIIAQPCSGKNPELSTLSLGALLSKCECQLAHDGCLGDCSTSGWD